MSLKTAEFSARNKIFVTIIFTGNIRVIHPNVNSVQSFKYTTTSRNSDCIFLECLSSTKIHVYISTYIRTQVYHAKRNNKSYEIIADPRVSKLHFTPTIISSHVSIKYSCCVKRRSWNDDYCLTVVSNSRINLYVNPRPLY